MALLRALDKFATLQQRAHIASQQMLQQRRSSVGSAMLLLNNNNTNNTNNSTTLSASLELLNEGEAVDVDSCIDDEQQQQQQQLDEAAEETREELMVASDECDDAELMSATCVHSNAKIVANEYLSHKRPEHTMLVFGELTSRIEHSTSHRLKCHMLDILVPWLFNLQLVDPNVLPTPSSKCSAKTRNQCNILAL